MLIQGEIKRQCDLEYLVIMNGTEMAEMTDGKDGDRKGVYVTIQRSTISIANSDSMFEKMFYNQNEGLEIRGI